MPKRTDINSILIIGAGPIIIGQACEFDYSGVQAVRALKEEGYRVILVNSNPATIMTDPQLADATYIEPLTWQSVAQVIERERPDALLPTMGGQTALNCALSLAKEGVLEKFNVEMIGANSDSIDKAEDRERFREAMIKLGLGVPHSAIAHSMEQAVQVQASIGFPCIIRPSFTLGGTGGGIAYNREEFEEICSRGLELSPTRELLIEESLLGWKEFELEVIRDQNDNAMIVCSIENVDPMGVHTGDSITVSPIQTLTDREYQILRNAAIEVLREIGVTTGGSNVQFAINPEDGRMIVIEMNPRVSRSSALASKATGFPIAKVAAKLAVGFTLDELKNEITQGATPASFEPTLDYVVTKIPRFNFEKFPGAQTHLTSQMKSVGEVMAIGRTFAESLQKALCSLDIGISGLTSITDIHAIDALDKIKSECKTPSDQRLRYVGDAFRLGQSVEWVFEQTQIDRWFLTQIKLLIDQEQNLQQSDVKKLSQSEWLHYKSLGFSDAYLATLLNTTEAQVRQTRLAHQVVPGYRRIDSCAAEFATSTAYLYSSWGVRCEAAVSDKQKIMVLGSGPNRIGQGIEFDYCCVHAAMAAQSAGYETLMVNCNPETVSTDYDTSDRLYFEPLTLEHVLSIIDIEKPQGVIVQYGGQTPLKLAHDLEQAGVTIVGTSPDAIDLAEDRARFKQLLDDLGLKQPINGTATDLPSALAKAEVIGFPLVVRPSYVLGGRAMEIVYNTDELEHYMRSAIEVSPQAPILLDHFLDSAKEVDVDAICDGEEVYIAGIMEHIEQAGVHSGDSSCSLPAFSLSESILQQLSQQVIAMAKALKVVGVMNTQFAIQGDNIYVLEVNPRASRTVPFVAKATGLPVAKVGALCMLGITLKQQGLQGQYQSDYVAIKLPVFPFEKFLGVDPILGPEMKSTGEVMGMGKNFAAAYAKALTGANVHLKQTGRVFISVRQNDKAEVVEIAKAFVDLGFSIVATHGTAEILQQQQIPCDRINKVREGRPHIVDMIKNDQIDFIVNTTEGKKAIKDSYTIRRSALQHRVNYTFTLSGAKAVIKVLQAKDTPTVVALKECYQKEIA